jgi:hypothetical protein
MSPDRDQLLKTRDALLAVLDAKLKDVPEWTSYRAVEFCLQAGGSIEASMPLKTRRRRIEAQEPYADLAIKAIESSGRPMSTQEVVSFIGAHRQIPPDPQKAKFNIGSGLSRDKRLQNVTWQGGRAWWHAGQSLPDHLWAVEKSAA